MEIIITEFHSDLDSFQLYSIYKDQENIIFLDSAMRNTYGRYSFIGVNPFLIIKGQGDNIWINGSFVKGDIFQQLRKYIDKYKVEIKSSIPFVGGCMGYFSYDYGLLLEEIKSEALKSTDIPEFYFVFYDNVIIIDHQNNRNYISACGILEKDKHKSTSEILDKIAKYKPINYEDNYSGSAEFRSNFTKEQYIKAVSRMKEYIRTGDIYIANMTQQFTAETVRSSYDIYKNLRDINPAPFAAFMKLEGFDIISSSPERFLNINNKIVETRPIKGTRPRGHNKEEDNYFKEQLINSEKDKAELLMIVDLERNDLSKVCKPHSVEVNQLFSLEAYSTVFHLVATVKGELENDKDALDCFKACFPGGSITGTPKIRAMEIIDELEKVNRSLYTGAIGYFSLNGDADFNIAIRTIIKKENTVTIGVGGGITWDSVEVDEYNETLDKAKALMKVI